MDPTQPDSRAAAEELPLNGPRYIEEVRGLVKGRSLAGPGLIREDHGNGE